MEKPEILVVDNDMLHCDTLVDQLSEKYTCHVAHSAKQATSLLPGISPKVLLLDKSLAGSNGAPLYKELAANDKNPPFAVFIISGDGNLDSRLDAFHNGADEYISKPFDVEELSARMERTVQYVTERETLRESESQLRSLVTTSMQQASQYGYVMNFFKLLNECSNVEQVASLFFEAMDYFQLKACLMTKLPTLQYWDHDLLDVSPIEKNVFELLAPKSRLYEFQNRMIVNDKHVSFIIKNMPSDPEAVGQARDFTAALVEGMESKILDLQLQAGIVNAAERLAQNVSTIKQAIFDHNRVISEVMSDMLTDISSSYHELEMTEQQETFFSEIVEKGVGKLGEADNLLYDLQTSLEELLDDMEEIKKEAINQQKESAPVSNNDIEFF